MRRAWRGCRGVVEHGGVVVENRGVVVWVANFNLKIPVTQIGAINRLGPLTSYYFISYYCMYSCSVWHHAPADNKGFPRSAGTLNGNSLRAAQTLVSQSLIVKHICLVERGQLTLKVVFSNLVFIAHFPIILIFDGQCLIELGHQQRVFSKRRSVSSPLIYNFPNVITKRVKVYASKNTRD